jgi:hypothetical protein
MAAALQSLPPVSCSCLDLFKQNVTFKRISKSPKRILSTTSEPQPQPEPETFSQFAKVDSGFLAWHFQILDDRGEELAYLSRAFRGFGREVQLLCSSSVIRFV